MASPTATPPDVAPSPIPAAKSTVITTLARMAAIPPAITHLARAIGVARIISRRPSFSSDAHFDTNVAAPKPAAIRRSCTYTWGQPPADVRAKLLKIVEKVA